MADDNANDKKNAPGSWETNTPTAVLVLADGTVLKGYGAGAEGMALGEVCFNTALTGYQEILTDPSYAGQIVTFTAPHIGNVGANKHDNETTNDKASAGVLGCILRAPISPASNYRAEQSFEAWLKKENIIALWGIDTRGLTALIREKGMLHGVIAHNKQGTFDLKDLQKRASDWAGINGLDLAKDVTSDKGYQWDEARWQWDKGYQTPKDLPLHVVAIDYGAKRNIFRCLVSSGAKVTVVPASTPADDILKIDADGYFLSNGPGDPAATGVYSVPVIEKLVESGKPVFGICLGHQMLALALGAKTKKMAQGHHGANHPVMDHTTGKVEITSMNHGFTVDQKSLPKDLEETHISLFDGTNCGIRLKGKPVFSVQYHPEASPGPQDSHYIFTRFANLIRGQKGLAQVRE